MPTLQVFEQQTLRVQKGELSIGEFEALALFNEQHQNKYFLVLHQGIRFKNYVGVLQVGQLTIEILPKLEQHLNVQDTWRNWLLQMLQFCQFIKIETSTRTQLAIHEGSLLDLYINFFITELEQIICKGRLSQYYTESSNQYSLKGKLLFEKQIQYNSIHKERFYTQRRHYGLQHDLHALLFRAIQITQNICKQHDQQRKLRQLLQYFEVPSLPSNFPLLSSTQIQKKLGQAHAYYKTSIEIAQMLIHHYTPDLRGGDYEVLGILFDMNLLFEEYIYRQCSSLRIPDLQIKKQVSRLFWEQKTLRPDLVIQYQDKAFVLDTKWKLLNYANPNDADLKQMYAYGQLFDSQRNILIYPQTSRLKNKRAAFHNQPNVTCELFFAEMLNEQKTLNFDLGQELIDWILG